jgi:hypothetical protein
LAQRWGCKAEAVIALIKAGTLPAFSVSPAGTRRPRYRISLEMVKAFEHQRIAQKKPETRRPRKPADRSVIEFFK